MPSPSASTSLLALLAALATTSATARADEAAPVASLDPHAAPRDPPFTIGTRPVWYGLAGATAGATLAGTRSAYVGGEASVVRLSGGGRFVGLDADGSYDFGVHRTYVTAGVEAGYKFFGVDAGPAARFGSDRVEWGVAGRAFVTVGLVSVYGRYVRMIDPVLTHDDNVVQVGLLLKLPFAVWGLD